MIGIIRNGCLNILGQRRFFMATKWHMILAEREPYALGDAKKTKLFFMAAVRSQHRLWCLNGMALVGSI